MTDYKLFTYPDPVDGQPLEAKKKIDLENVMDDTDKSLLQEWFPVDPTDPAHPDQVVDYGKYAKVLLDGVSQLNIWVGIGKRESEVVTRWQEERPWLPELIIIPGKENYSQKNLIATDAAPVTQYALFKELRNLLYLDKYCMDSTDKIIKSITLMPAWQQPTGIRDHIGEGENLFEGSEYQLKNVSSKDWRSLAKRIVEQFKIILPRLDLDLEHQVEVDGDKCIPKKEFGCDGLCGAWFVVKVPEIGNSTDCTVRIPVGLIKPTGDNDPTPKLVLFDEDKTNVYTSGLDYRFLCLENNKTSAEAISETVFTLNVFVRKKNPLRQGIISQGLDLVIAPFRKIMVLDYKDWWESRGPDRKSKAKELIPFVVSREPLAVFRADGIHLLENEEQIKTWCANNKLLDKLFTAYFSHEIRDICWIPEEVKEDPANVKKPIDSYSPEGMVRTGGGNPKKCGYWPGGKRALTEDTQIANTVDDETSQKLLSVLYSTRHANSEMVSENIRQLPVFSTGDAKYFYEKKQYPITIQQFRELDNTGRMCFIDNLWGAVVKGIAFKTEAEVMYEPDSVPSGNLPFPTSWCPETQGDLRSCRKRVEGMPWQKFHVGFRVTGKGTVKRIVDKHQSMTRQLGSRTPEDKDFVLETRGLNLKDTIIENNPLLAWFWTGNHDIFDETAVCVSRNFFGATAFPERDSDGDFFLWAVDCTGLRGCDTEGEQINSGNARWWRPGEKAFHEIPWDNIIGYVPIKRIKKSSEEKGASWKFKIEATEWVFLPLWVEVEDEEKKKKLAYIKEELSAWRGFQYSIPHEWDFAQT